LERKCNGNLGNAYYSLGNFNKAIEYHTKHLNICIDIGNKSGEGMAYCNLGDAYDSLGDFNKAIEYHTKYLNLCIDIGDQFEEGKAYCNHGIADHSLLALEIDLEKKRRI
jgi:tetratricopeptide (TPR) repeat protein